MQFDNFNLFFTALTLFLGNRMGTWLAKKLVVQNPPGYYRDG